MDKSKSENDCYSLRSKDPDKSPDDYIKELKKWAVPTSAGDFVKLSDVLSAINGISFYYGKKMAQTIRFLKENKNE